MRNALLSGMFAAAAVAALVVALSAAPAAAQGQKGAKMTPKPAGPGFCTAHVNAFKWGHMHWRTSTGATMPTLAMCYEPNCPAKC
ncbi:MAG: hypothetical protein IT539_13875 [Bradyrhizobiaceae bacterium]|nr:hypothetical protein [Bradyrhizobiaceae bacterium]